jgi:hypothetical protein
MEAKIPSAMLITVIRRMPARIEIQLRLKSLSFISSAGWLVSRDDLRLFFLVFEDKVGSWDN